MGQVLGRDVPVLGEDEVHTFLDDFTTADLRTVTLIGIDLGDVRWSEHGTQWPDGVNVEDLKTRSEETPEGSGIYVIRSGEAAMHDFVNFGIARDRTADLDAGGRSRPRAEGTAPLTAADPASRVLRLQRGGSNKASSMCVMPSLAYRGVHDASALDGCS
ncbi:hypothetical protein J5X84_43675 [Streptosporangiaceae bacterium NEAU-GS5]|nr:hypothetical protein [Streptosporangiaceae bacterium NEAU-GS5]